MERMDVVPLHPMASPTKGSGIDDSASAEPCAGCQRTGLSLLACDDPEATPLPTNEKLRCDLVSVSTRRFCLRDGEATGHASSVDIENGRRILLAFASTMEILLYYVCTFC